MRISDATSSSKRPLIAAGMCVVSVATLSLLGPSHPADAVGAIVKSDNLRDVEQKVKSTSEQLSEAAHAVLAAEDALEDIANELPGAKRDVAAANSKVAQAQQAARDAAAAVVAAQAAVVEAKKQVAKIEQEIAALRTRIAALAAQVYRDGGQYQELEILLNAKDPQDFVVQIASVRRTARNNSVVLDELDALQAQLRTKLAELKQAQDAAADKQAQADQREADARAAQESARAAQAKVEQMIAKQQAAVVQAQANRKTVKRAYEQLLVEQKRLIAEAAAKAAAGKWDGTIPPGGTPQAIAAVKFALSQVGHRYVSSGGTGPNYGCNGFSWRAWHEGGSKWPVLLAHDQAMNRRWVVPVPAGQEMPGDLIFWRMNNGTDSRPNAIDHVGLIVDPASGLFVHAANTRRGVVTDTYKSGHYSGPAMIGRIVG